MSVRLDGGEKTPAARIASGRPYFVRAECPVRFGPAPQHGRHRPVQQPRGRHIDSAEPADIRIGGDEFTASGPGPLYSDAFRLQDRVELPEVLRVRVEE